jgi:hypothetical protein
MISRGLVFKKGEKGSKKGRLLTQVFPKSLDSGIPRRDGQADESEAARCVLPFTRQPELRTALLLIRPKPSSFIASYPTGRNCPRSGLMARIGPLRVQAVEDRKPRGGVWGREVNEEVFEVPGRRVRMAVEPTWRAQLRSILTRALAVRPCTA